MTDRPPDAGPSSTTEVVGGLPDASSFRALLLAALVTLGCFAGYRFLILTAWPIEKGAGLGDDFQVFWRAANALLTGITIYTNPGAIGAYIYPPPLAILLVPAVLLHLPGDPYDWFMVCVGVLPTAGSIWLLGLFAPHRRWVVWSFLTSAALGAWPVALLLRQGQVDALTLLVLVAGLLAAWRKRWWWTAFWFGLAASLKVTPGVLILYLLWKRQYRAAAGSAAVALGIVLVTGLVVGFGDLGVYVTQVLPRIGSEGNTYFYNQSVHAVFLRLFYGGGLKITQPVVDLSLQAVLLMTAITGLILITLVLLGVPRRWPETSGVFVSEAGAFMLLEVLLSSLSWQMHAVWLLAPLGGLVLVLLERRKIAWWLPLAVGIGMLGFMSGPYQAPLEYGRFATGWSTILQSHTVAADLWLLALCVYASRSAARSPVAAPSVVRDGETGRRLLVETR